MGTRGFIIIKFNNKYYAIYNHYDSYFSYLGLKIMNYLKELIQANELNNTEDCLNAMINYFTPESEYSVIENTIDFYCLDGEWFYIVDLNEMLLTIKSNKFAPYYIKYSLRKDNEFSIFNCIEQ
jgi:hypothetical protein